MGKRTDEENINHVSEGPYCRGGLLQGNSGNMYVTKQRSRFCDLCQTLEKNPQTPALGIAEIVCRQGILVGKHRRADPPHGITPVIPPKSNSVDHGTGSPMDLIVIAHKHYKGLYRKNHKPELRSTVEHSFGNVTQEMPRIMDHKAVNRAKALLTPFLWYNHELLVRGLESMN